MVLVDVNKGHNQDIDKRYFFIYDYVAASIAGIRAATKNAAIPVEPVGQMFDVYSDGKHSPTRAEVSGAIRAAQEGKAAGISFFEWNHATPDEWDALQTHYTF